MPTRRRKTVARLLSQIQFIDLSQAVARPRTKRKAFLTQYVDRELVDKKRFASYGPFRDAVSMIYGMRLDLDPSPPVDIDTIVRTVKAKCQPSDEARNTDAVKELHKLIRDQGYLAYYHPPKNLSLGIGRVARIGLEIELVQGEQLIFQYPYPRMERLSDHEIAILLSLIRQAYAVGDRKDAVVQMADLSAPELDAKSRREKVPRVREPRIVTLGPSELLTMEELQPEVQHVHDLLLELGDEPDGRE